MSQWKQPRPLSGLPNPPYYNFGRPPPDPRPVPALSDLNSSTLPPLMLPRPPSMPTIAPTASTTPSTLPSLERTLAAYSIYAPVPPPPSPSLVGSSYRSSMGSSSHYFHHAQSHSHYSPTGYSDSTPSSSISPATTSFSPSNPSSSATPLPSTSSSSYGGGGMSPSSSYPYSSSSASLSGRTFSYYGGPVRDPTPVWGPQ